METPPSLPKGEECLTEASEDGSSYTKGYHKVGTDALVCPPKHSHKKSPAPPPKEGMLPNGIPKGDEKADRRGRLSLQVGIFFK